MAVSDADFMYQRAFGTREKMVKFFENPNAMTEIFHFTDHDELEIYDEVDPNKRPELSQSGKVVLITGGGRGIGRGIALVFAQAKAKGIAICARTMSQLEETRRAISDRYPEVEVYAQQVDVTSTKDMKSFFDETKAKFGRIDVAVSNAGTNRVAGTMAACDVDDWWHEQTVNQKGLYLVSRYFTESLDGTSGTLINISSSSALGCVPYQSSYTISKAAGVRLMEVLNLESPNVRCFSIHPGVVDTDMVREAAERTGTAKEWHFTEPTLTGAMILWLTTEKGEFLRGRWLSANWNVTELEQRKDVIVGQNLLKTAFNAQLGL